MGEEISKDTYKTYIEGRKKIEDFFDKQLIYDGEKNVKFDQDQIRNIHTALNNQQSLVSRNRTLFLSINSAVLGFASKTYIDIVVTNSPPAEISSLYVVILCAIGLYASHLWGETTRFRRHKVWFMESLLVCLEEGWRLNKSAGGITKMLNYIDDHQKIRLLKQKDGVSSVITTSHIREIFRNLRHGFIGLWLLLSVLVLSNVLIRIKTFGGDNWSELFNVLTFTVGASVICFSICLLCSDKNTL